VTGQRRKRIIISPLNPGRWWHHKVIHTHFIFPFVLHFSLFIIVPPFSSLFSSLLFLFPFTAVIITYSILKKKKHKEIMRKREQGHYYMDIFEPTTPWRAPSLNNMGGGGAYLPQSPTHRSPLHHQPSLSEIVYQDYNTHSEMPGK
jgi:hypothetical protein